jgi:hypothetical protein
MGVADWVATVGTIIAVPLVTWLVAKSSRRASSEQAAITRLEKNQTEMERQLRLQGDYIYELRGHIADGKKGPPPPWPEGLNR